MTVGAAAAATASTAPAVMNLGSMASEVLDCVVRVIEVAVIQMMIRID